MSPTLNLFSSLLNLGRRYRDLGRLLDACRVLDSLASFRELPASIAEKVQAELAEIHLKRKNYRRARRHLTAALGHDPNNAHYHYLLAFACRADAQGNQSRAGVHYRRALELDPENVKCLSEYGLYLVRDGCIEQGLALLRKAVDIAPADVEAANRLIKGMRRAGLAEEAREAAKSALFRNPRSPRFLQLWRDFQFRQMHRQQAVKPCEEARPKKQSGARVLPFVRLPSTVDELADLGKVRADGPETLSPPHRKKSARRRVQ